MSSGTNAASAADSMPGVAAQRGQHALRELPVGRRVGAAAGQVVGGEQHAFGPETADGCRGSPGTAGRRAQRPGGRGAPARPAGPSTLAVAGCGRRAALPRAAPACGSSRATNQAGAIAADDASPTADRRRRRRPARRASTSVWKRIGNAPERSPARRACVAHTRQHDAGRWPPHASISVSVRTRPPTRTRVRAEREANTELPLADAGARQQQVCGVAADGHQDEQHQRTAAAHSAAPSMRCGPRGGLVNGVISARSDWLVSG